MNKPNFKFNITVAGKPIYGFDPTECPTVDIKEYPVELKGSGDGLLAWGQLEGYMTLRREPPPADRKRKGDWEPFPMVVGAKLRDKSTDEDIGLFVAAAFIQHYRDGSVDLRVTLSNGRLYLLENVFPVSMGLDDSATMSVESILVETIDFDVKSFNERGVKMGEFLCDACGATILNPDDAAKCPNCGMVGCPECLDIFTCPDCAHEYCSDCAEPDDRENPCCPKCGCTQWSE